VDIDIFASTQKEPTVTTPAADCGNCHGRLTATDAYCGLPVCSSCKASLTIDEAIARLLSDAKDLSRTVLNNVAELTGAQLEQLTLAVSDSRLHDPMGKLLRRVVGATLGEVVRRESEKFNAQDRDLLVEAVARASAA
jgi:hypothetical protein